MPYHSYSTRDVEPDWIAYVLCVLDLGDDGIAGHVSTGALYVSIDSQLQVVPDLTASTRPLLHVLVKVHTPTEQ